ncbi:MAG TPA: SPOR domain-containing protein [Spongiibacteraceae bacterium]|nr:SPOR domain-containing protein [Spongiibacteraceae bacterium]MBN51758.1 SPOR domain-containing protein [Spongiibacteraceae bacterium]HCS28949.1 SPOR domain-containing protein [Spongiibacteraceae bacterium]|tara:strand:- start:82 stop:627 length:546 start_codon:yes stop_codon:yes gene_type:complete
MATAKRSSRGATRSNGSGTPSWVVFCAGALCGGFLTFLIFLGGVDNQPGNNTKQEAAVAPKPAKPDKKTDSNTQFDFFTLLPEREVIVPDEQPRDVAASTEQYNYILQAGSFKTGKDADRRRAELLLLGLEAKIEAVEANGDTWHRVYVGPFTSRSKLSKARSTLISEGIETLLLKRKLEG